MNKTKILLFEDREPHFKKLKKLLETAEYEVIPNSFSELKFAFDDNTTKHFVINEIKKYWNNGLRLIICDLMAQKIKKGDDIIREIRENVIIPECPSFSMLIPIIVWTGACDLEQILDSLRIGANDFVYKPHWSENKKDKENDEENWKIFKSKIVNSIMQFERKLPYLNQFPAPHEIEKELKAFKEKYKGKKTAFIMTSFSEEHKAIAEKIKKILHEDFDIEGLLADVAGGENDDDLWNDIQVYLHGCDFGIGIYADDSIVFNDKGNQNNIRINPNLSQEIGYLLALQKRVCILKHNSLEKIPTDLSNRIYIPINSSEDSIYRAIGKWLRNKHII